MSPKFFSSVKLRCVVPLTRREEETVTAVPPLPVNPVNGVPSKVRTVEVGSMVVETCAQMFWPGMVEPAIFTHWPFASAVKMLAPEVAAPAVNVPAAKVADVEMEAPTPLVPKAAHV